MDDFVILTDTRQQKESHIIKAFDRLEKIHIKTKLDSGDYMALRYDNGFKIDYSVIIDTKKDLVEVAHNLCNKKEHDRVVREVELAHEMGCQQFIFLIGETNIKTIPDIIGWRSPHTKVKGETLLKIMGTFQKHHNCKFVIVPKRKMGEKIIALLTKK